jgi:hypothetical protein
VAVTEDNEQYKEYVQTLEFLFPSVDDGDEMHNVQSPGSNIVITKLLGESITIVYNPDQFILDLMVTIEKELKTPCKKQCLLYNNIELEVAYPRLIFLNLFSLAIAHISSQNSPTWSSESPFSISKRTRSSTLLT